MSSAWLVITGMRASFAMVAISSSLCSPAPGGSDRICNVKVKIRFALENLGYKLLTGYEMQLPSRIQ